MPRTFKKFGGPVGPRHALPGPVLNATGVLDFGVKINTSLKMLIVGNSLSVQHRDTLERAFCVDNSTEIAYNGSSPLVSSNNNNTVANATNSITPNSGTYLCRAINLLADPTVKQDLRNLLTRLVHLPDGGIMIHWGSGKMLELNNQDWAPGSQLVSNLWKAVAAHQTTNQQSVVVSEAMLDVMIFHIPSGHVAPQEVTDASLSEVLAVAWRTFHCSAVLFITMAWHNNLSSDDARVEWNLMNERVREFSQTYRPSTTDQGVQIVEYLDFAAFSRLTTIANGASLGIPDDQTFSVRLEGAKFQNVVAHSCGALPKPRLPHRRCHPNMLSRDGMHWCPETIHGRLNAGTACILGCMYNNKQNQRHQDVTISATDASAGLNTSLFVETWSKEEREYVRNCSSKCNERFMSLDPIRFNEDDDPIEMLWDAS